ncbi:MAG: S41 family peptidase [Gammaproteobacteria bacterium]|nr:S41 family peptidase [Gammaproteobacteria bacterium]
MKFPYPLAAALVLVGALVLGPLPAAAQQPATEDAPAAEKTKAKPELPLDKLRLFTEVFGRIKQDYVVDVSDDQLLDYAIQGMLAGLDPHSSFLDAESFREIRIGTSGQFGGLGIEVGMEDGFVKVIAPIDDTPAQKAGVQAGDLIIRLDDTPVKGMTLNEAVKLMRGEPGEDIVLTIVREGQDQPLTLTITRDVIKVKSVRSRVLEPGYGYVRISQFRARTGENLLQVVEELKEGAGGALKGMVLDLRNNPGGVLNGAVEVSDAFLDEGLIVYTEGRIADSKLSFSATPGDVLDGAPLVVLVNGGSASASEIVAGALQDHARAVILGEATFGKGSVQTIMPIGQETALKLTTARYYTPSGRSIQAEGIVPDIALGRVRLAALEGQDIGRLKEADLSGHLENGEKAPGVQPEAPDVPGPAEIVDDYPLNEALNLLKGLHLLQKDRARG